MGKVIANMSMSLDGFVAHPTDGVNLLFKWYQAGEVTLPTEDPDHTFHLDEASAELLRDGGGQGEGGLGALLYGRVTFDEAKGWGGHHPMGAPVVVLTHHIPDGWPREGSSVEFVTDGIEQAVQRCKELAGERIVAVGSADLMQQCLNAGLLDEIQVDLVPLLLGEGVRYFERIQGTPFELTVRKVVAGNGVTHLHYGVVPRPTPAS